MNEHGKAPASPIEPFTLTVWLIMAQRFEATQVDYLGRGECVELLMRISGDRGGSRVKGQCIGAPAVHPPGRQGTSEMGPAAGRCPGRCGASEPIDGFPR
jgi:hypothetical protein